MKENEDKRLAESIVQVLTSANEKLFEKMMEGAQGPVDRGFAPTGTEWR